ncbi:SPOR domain-containing protein [Paraglaciecola hydrolytica]|uniref:SPOR domain-containing protein n=1 Tax=Paraglaciecola hydrolytica TaxID=1799789 RepID=A0A136A1S9_9ALTE|nr:hypothetical protein [Paraglaciecola hydrolytica]KXI29192.1 hypothetical protein AX660_13670 [Paraglaciecola hydrolytica]
MAVSGLQDRLDYLVSYASQLIFIESESTDQTSVLDTFISESPEQVEIALLSASPTTPLVKYRETIYRQLVSQSKNPDFNRPLNQLLVDLNEHNGPLIISISKAENLPNKLLQELWELVLQSRFANNKQHLNVLLFAQATWAKQARNQLQSRTGDKPLLLNQTNKLPKLKQSSSELDSLIALKRQQFSDRLQKRAQQQASYRPLLKRKGVIAIFIGVFLLLFAGILSLQYPALFTPAPEVSTLPNTSAQANEQDVSTNTQEVAELVSTKEQVAKPITSPSINIATQSAVELSDDSAVLAETLSSSPDPLVTSWSEAVAKIEEDPAKYLVAKPQQAFIEQQETNTQQINPETETNTAVAIDSAPAPTNNVARAPISSVEFPNGLELRDGQYLIQISAMSDNYLLQQFMQENPLSQHVWSYTTQRFGSDWHVLLFNQLYPSLDSARAALVKLSPALLTYEPFIKSAKQIKQELAQKGR